MTCIYLPNEVYVITVNSRPAGFVYEPDKIGLFLDQIATKYEMSAIPTYQTSSYQTDDGKKRLICGRPWNELSFYESTLYVIEASPVKQIVEEEEEYTDDEGEDLLILD